MAINKDTITGKAQEIKGQVREQVGKFTNNSKQVIKGNAEQVAGKARQAYGDIKEDAQRNINEGIDKVKKSLSSDEKTPERELPNVEKRTPPSVVDPQGDLKH